MNPLQQSKHNLHLFFWILMLSNPLITATSLNLSGFKAESDTSILQIPKKSEQQPIDFIYISSNKKQQKEMKLTLWALADRCIRITYWFTYDTRLFSIDGYHQTRQ